MLGAGTIINVTPCSFEAQYDHIRSGSAAFQLWLRIETEQVLVHTHAVFL